MKPNDYQVAAKDSAGYTVAEILAQSDVAVVYTTTNNNLRWHYDGELPTNVRPAVSYFNRLMARIKASKMEEALRYSAYHLLGQCLHQAFLAADPATNKHHFAPVVEFVNEHAPRRRIITKFTNLSWPTRIAVVFGLLLLGCVLWPWGDAYLASRVRAQETLCQARGIATELVVLVHGYEGSFEKMDGVVQAVREERPNADVLFFSYPASTFANTDPFTLADRLEQLIAKYDLARSYQRIVLSGHSAGALIVRKAFVYGCGNVEDSPLAGYAATTRPVRRWVKKVDRMVLLAGMNRGWNPQFGPAAAGLASPVQKLGLYLARLTGTGKYIRGFERGEPFVANLRLQWLATMQRAKAGQDGLRAPVVLQLLGDRDPLVAKEDSRDILVTGDFISVAVNNTGHDDIIRLSETGDGLERKNRIQSAFGSTAAVEELRKANPIVATGIDPDVTTVVFVLHGIRDMGEWTSEFKKPLEEGFLRQHQGTKDKIYIHRAGYGYFPMGAFLLLGDRQKNVRWFMDQVTELRARFPRLKEIDFIGHSNGTYILASALEKYRTLNVYRVVFAGSVVRRDYRWSDYIGRVGQVRNYVGASDWVVGLFPRLFELPGFHFFNPDIGSAGFNGFQDGFVKNFETEFIVGGHGGALEAKNIKSIVEFILHGTKSDVPELVVPEHPAWLDLLSRVCWIVWICLAGLIIAVGWQLPKLLLTAMKWVGRQPKISDVTLAWISRAVYVAGVWLLLLTI
jgi:pimeloyl-ACP methyl ester carboxylesterase